MFIYPLNCECISPSQLKIVHVTLSFSTSNSADNTVHLSWTGLQFGFTPQSPLKSLTITKSQILGRIQMYLYFLNIQNVSWLPKIPAREQEPCQEIIKHPSWINSDLIKSNLIWSNLISVCPTSRALLSADMMLTQWIGKLLPALAMGILIAGLVSPQVLILWDYAMEREADCSGTGMKYLHHV